MDKEEEGNKYDQREGETKKWKKNKIEGDIEKAGPGVWQGLGLVGKEPQGGLFRGQNLGSALGLYARTPTQHS